MESAVADSVEQEMAKTAAPPEPTTTGADTLALPPAAQPRHREKSPVHPPWSTAPSQNASPTIELRSLSPSDENDRDSDDSLRMMPFGPTQLSTRTNRTQIRSPSQQPATCVGLSRTTSLQSAASSNGTLAVSQNGQRSIADDAMSDDELAFQPSSQLSNASQPARTQSTFVCVQVPPASRRTSPSIVPRSSPPPTAVSSRSSPGPDHIPEDCDSADSSMTLEAPKKRRKKAHTFELCIKKKQQSPVLSRDAQREASSVAVTRSPSPPPRVTSPRAPSPQSPALSRLSPPPLQTKCLDEAENKLSGSHHSSPLSSLAESSPSRSSSNSTSSAKSSSRIQLSPIDSDCTIELVQSEDEHVSVSTPKAHSVSPKKRARIPRFTVKAVTNSPPSSFVDSIANKKQPKSKKPRIAMVHDDLDEVDRVAILEALDEDSNFARPRRTRKPRQASRHVQSVTVDEDDEEESSGSATEAAYSSPPRKSTPTKRHSKKMIADLGKNKKEPAKTKGRGKGGKQTDSETSGTQPRSSLKAASSFLFELSQPSTANSRETPEERADGWDVRAFDDYVWIHVDEREQKGGFWWLGKITNKLRSQRPLLIELFLDPKRMILEHSEDQLVTIDNPSPENLLKFRSQSITALRFTHETFLDPSSPTPSSPDIVAAFNSALEQALRLESSSEQDLGSDNSDMMADPAQLGLSPRSDSCSPKEKRRQTGIDCDEDVEAESDDGLLKEHDEMSGSFPFYCIAKDKGGWWAATCVGYAAQAKQSKKNPAKKYRVEYPNGQSAVLPRSSLLFSIQKQFLTVKLEETVVEFQPQYLENAIKFIKELCGQELQQILDETYLPAQPRNELFYAGGRKREELARTSVFGELPSEYLEAFSDTIQSWLLPTTGERPKGSLRYEALAPLDRIRYVADVLLPASILLNYIDDLSDSEENLLDRVRKEQGKPDATAAELEVAVFELAYTLLSSLESMREGRKAAQRTASQRSRN
ncbi:uncharacterized protein JCM15063_001524 [Sporobolomyces koalae]|uniref:uncharacterized protein n=1 Tax=Sporobolomyces koalae TaxID=500713 RepID=UPI00317CD87A